MEGHVDFVPGLTDSGLRDLYVNAGALLFTSVFEGNFPPQIFEALTLGTPIVAGDIPMIREWLGDATNLMAVARPLDLDGFVENAQRVLRDPEAVREKQKRVLEMLLTKADDRAFLEAVGRFYSGGDPSRLSAPAPSEVSS